MKTISWNEANEIAKVARDGDKVTIITFANPDCEMCKEFENNINQIKNDNVIFYKVDDQENNLFPISNVPSSFVYVPGTKRILPRPGGAPKDIIEQDIKKQVYCMKNGLDYDEVKGNDFS